MTLPATTPSSALDPRPAVSDLVLLREENARLEKQISNLAFLRLALLLAITFIFARATLHHSNDAIHDTIASITEIVQARKEVSPSRLDPLTLYISTPTWSSPSDQLDQLTARLTGLYSDLLRVNLTVIGTSINFDLRLLILTSPLWIALSHLFMSVLVEKRRMIRFLINMLNRKRQPLPIPALDRLLFSQRESPYSAFPSRLIEWAFWLVAIVLLVFTTKIIGLSDDTHVPFVAWTLLFAAAYAFYLQAFTSHILRLFQREVEAAFVCLVPPDLFSRLWSQAVFWLYALPARTRPLLTLRTAGLLILSTLVLPTAQIQGCGTHVPPPRFFAVKQSPQIASSGSTDGEVRPGYQLFNGRASWPTPLGAPIFGSGGLIYKLLILMAVLALPLGFCTPGRSKSYRRFVRALAVTAFALSLCLIVQFGELLYFPFPLAISGLRYLLYAVPSSIVIATILFSRGVRKRWNHVTQGIHHILRILYAPFLLADLLILVGCTKDTPGIVILFIGTHLLTLGLLSLRGLIPAGIH